MQIHFLSLQVTSNLSQGLTQVKIELTSEKVSESFERDCEYNLVFAFN